MFFLLIYELHVVTMQQSPLAMHLISLKSSGYRRTLAIVFTEVYTMASKTGTNSKDMISKSLKGSDFIQVRGPRKRSYGFRYELKCHKVMLVASTRDSLSELVLWLTQQFFSKV